MSWKCIGEIQVAHERSEVFLQINSDVLSGFKDFSDDTFASIDDSDHVFEIMAFVDIVFAPIEKRFERLWRTAGRLCTIGW